MGRRPVTVALSLCFALVAAACGGGDAATTTTEPSTTTTTAAPTTTVAETITTTTLPPTTTTTTLQAAPGLLTFEFDGRIIEAEVADCPADQLFDGGNWAIGSLQGGDMRPAFDADGAEWGVMARLGGTGFRFAVQAEPDGVPTYEVANTEEVVTEYGDGTASFSTIFELLAGVPPLPFNPPVTITVTCDV